MKPGKAAGVRGNALQAKPTGDVAIIAPAFIASRADIDSMGDMLREAIAEF